MTEAYAFQLLPYHAGYDHQSFRLGEKGRGFIGIKELAGVRMVGLDQCPKCGHKNYSMAVLELQCAWCGFDATPFIPSPLPPTPDATP